jgi:hypothetical protein
MIADMMPKEGATVLTTNRMTTEIADREILTKDMKTTIIEMIRERDAVEVHQDVEDVLPIPHQAN